MDRIQLEQLEFTPQEQRALEVNSSMKQRYLQDSMRLLSAKEAYSLNLNKILEKKKKQLQQLTVPKERYARIDSLLRAEANLEKEILFCEEEIMKLRQDIQTLMAKNLEFEEETNKVKAEHRSKIENNKAMEKLVRRAQDILQISNGSYIVSKGTRSIITKNYQ